MSQPFLRRLRRLLLLIPAAWKAGEKGLPVEKAVAVTGARELREDVAAAGSLDLAPSLPEDFLAVSVEGDRVFVDSAMQLLR